MEYNICIQEIKKKLIEIGFFINQNKNTMDTTTNISKINKPELEEKLRRIIDNI